MTDVLAPTLPSTFNPETGAGESVGELRQPSSSGNPAQPRSGHLNLDTFSPVNQNGSFAFDRVLKSGEINKRTRKTKVRELSSLRQQLGSIQLIPCLAMESILPRPTSEPPLTIQRLVRVPSAQADLSLGPDGRRIPEGPQRST